MKEDSYFISLIGRNAVLFLGLILLTSCLSCSKKPKDFPPVFPCTITVTKNDAPVSGAELQLLPASGGSSLAIGAMTDSNGTATLQTALGQYVKSGAPAGTWKVTIVKESQPEETKTEAQLAAMSEGERDKYRYQQQVKAKKLPPAVPYILGTPSTTPLQVNVAAPQTEMTVEVTEYKDTPEILKQATATAPIE